MAKRVVKLYGPLGKKYGKQFELDVRTAAEALRAIDANRPGFLREIKNLAMEGYEYKITTGDKRKSAAAGLDDLVAPSSGQISITPMLKGAKRKNGLTQVLVAAVVIVAAVYTGGLAAGGAGAGGTGAGAGAGAAASSGMATFSSAMMNIGVSLMIGGVMQMLTPTSDSEGASDERSYLFDGPVNTQAQGNPVPIGYGEMIVGSSVISAGITVANVSGMGGDSQPGWESGKTEEPPEEYIIPEDEHQAGNP